MTPTNNRTTINPNRKPLVKNYKLGHEAHGKTVTSVEVDGDREQTEGDEISFQSVHEALGKTFVEEKNRRKAAQSNQSPNSDKTEARKESTETGTPLLMELI